MSLQSFGIRYIGQLQSIEMIKRSLELTPQQVEFYTMHNQVFEQFDVFVDNHHWIVLKNKQEIEKFAHYLEKSYPLQENDNKLKLSKSSNKNVIKIQNLMKLESIDFSDKKIIEFFEVYDLQFNKVKSIKLKKKSGGRYVDKFCCKCSWKERSFVITQNGILYHKNRHDQKKICQYISFNKYFSLECGIVTGSEWGILIKSYHRMLKVYAQNIQKFVITVYFLKKTLNQYNEGRQHNLYGAFSAPKDNNSIEFLVDGEEYFGAVAKAISKAKHEVMIAGWWISPEFYLVRPIDPKNPEKNRFSSILKEIIKKNNVKIYILAYRESAMFLPNDSKYTKEALQSISPNIKVITHPINLIPSLWSHHQKIVIVDQKIAFVGGLDLCYGRFDTSEHFIKDDQNLYPGIQFNNSRIKDFQKVREYEISNIMRSKHPRLPWHDVSMRIVGGSVADIVKHFVQYWNFASYESLYQERTVLVPESTKVKRKIKNMMNELKNKIWHAQQNTDQIEENRKDKKTPKKKLDDHTIKNMIGEEMQDRSNNKKSSNQMKGQLTVYQSGEELISRTQIDQQAWKKIHKQPQTNQTQPKKRKRSSLPQKTSLKENIKRLFDLNNNKNEQYYDSDNGDYLNERSYDFEDEHKDVINKIKHKHRWSWINDKTHNYQENKVSKMKNDISRSQKSMMDVLAMERIDKCQVLRSVSKWSIGCKQTESEASIHSAYLDMIKNAESFIYIENQFFMSAIDGEKVLKNRVAKALMERISRAINRKQKFRVLFFIPLIPGFAGELDDPDAILPRVIMHWQFLTIFNGQNSVIKSIERLTPDPSRYIQFYGLRTHDLIKEKPQTQIVYLHTKLMIVDDKKAIIGSANINDRSMRGTRDSQIAVIINGGRQVQSTINGKACTVNEKIRNLRMKLMKEHFGQKDLDQRTLNFIDMLDSRMFENLQNIAKQNTQTYRKLFGCYPDNNIKTLKELHRYERKPTKEEYLELSQKIHGHVVHFPYKFLNKQNLLEGNTLYPNGITT